MFLGNISKPQSRKPILFHTCIKGLRRHAQFDPSLPLPKPCIFSQPELSPPPPKPLTIPVLEPFDTLKNTVKDTHNEKYTLSDVVTTLLSPIYSRLPTSNSAFKQTTSSLDNLSETFFKFTLRRPPRHRYIL